MRIERSVFGVLRVGGLGSGKTANTALALGVGVEGIPHTRLWLGFWGNCIHGYGWVSGKTAYTALAGRGQGFRLRISVFGFRLSVLWFQFPGFGFRVSGLGLRA